MLHERTKENAKDAAVGLSNLWRPVFSREDQGRKHREAPPLESATEGEAIPETRGDLVKLDGGDKNHGAVAGKTDRLLLWPLPNSVPGDLGIEEDGGTSRFSRDRTSHRRMKELPGELLMRTESVQNFAC